ncbi:hypothetical protein V6N13_005068 [Hibiscus sabdariffa]
MASNTFFTPLIDLDLTVEEQSSIFTPNVDWDIPTIDPTVLIRKLFATKEIDNQTFLRAYSNIWKKDNLLSISHIGEIIYHVHFDNAAKCTEILNRGPWLFKNDWTQGHIHYHAPNPTTPTSGTKLPVLDKEAIVEPVHPSDEGLAANPAHLSLSFLNL